MRDAETASEAEDLKDFKVQGPLRRNRALLLLVLVALVAAPLLSHFLLSYRGVVLEIRDDEMLVGFAQQPPDWKAAIDVQPGAIIEKTTGSFGPELSPVTDNDNDKELLSLYRRYTRAYTGTIVAIRPPTRPGGASVAVIELDSGGQEQVALWADHLATAAVGRRVEKRPGAWDPHLIESNLDSTDNNDVQKVKD